MNIQNTIMRELEKHFIDESTTDLYPKTLLVKNSIGGAVWQLYHVKNKAEVEMLTNGAHGNGYESVCVVDHCPNDLETFVDWRKERKSAIAKKIKKLQSEMDAL